MLSQPDWHWLVAESPTLLLHNEGFAATVRSRHALSIPSPSSSPHIADAVIEPSLMGYHFAAMYAAVIESSLVLWRLRSVLVKGKPDYILQLNPTHSLQTPDSNGDLSPGGGKQKFGGLQAGLRLGRSPVVPVLIRSPVVLGVTASAANPAESN